MQIQRCTRMLAGNHPPHYLQRGVFMNQRPEDAHPAEESSVVRDNTHDHNHADADAHDHPHADDHAHPHTEVDDHAHPHADEHDHPHPHPHPHGHDHGHEHGHS